MTQPYISVSTLTRYIKRKFDVDPYMQKVWIKAEISNFTHHQRNHLYFTLKDENSKISAVMFARDAATLQFIPENGMKVLIEGSISVFEKSGSYQIYVQSMTEDGIGNLYLAFQKMKEKLEKEGLFDVSRKKQIPKYPSHIGVITSPTGAAIQDIVTTLRRRYPMAKVTLFPAIVQGEYAAPSVVKSIQRAEDFGGIDVLIVGRGGGSIEELWAFNEEIVARAIANCKIPVISAVGHETDTTIADFVADLRAPTPTAAAELATPNLLDLKERVLKGALRLETVTQKRMEDLRVRVNRLNASYYLKNPRALYGQKEQQLDYMMNQLDNSIKSILQRKELQYSRTSQKLDIRYLQKGVEKHRIQVNYHMKQMTSLVNHIKLRSESSFGALTSKLDALSPLKIMDRGYSIVKTGDKIITSTAHVDVKSEIKVQLQDGQLACTVNSIEKRESKS